MNLIAYIIKRILKMIPLLITVSIIGFFLIKISPVDPLAELKMNPSISRETLKTEEQRLGLDKPVTVQYFIWAKNFVRGNFGVCTTGEKVSDKLAERIPNTLLLTGAVLFFTWLIGIPAGIVAALNRGKPLDWALTIISGITMAIPSFFLALLMLIFAVKTGCFPAGGLTSYNFSGLSIAGKVVDIAKHLVLPVFVLTAVSFAGLQRQMRANLLDVLDSEYVKYARATGLSETKVIVKHALRNSLNPMITLLGFEFASLLSGAALTEYVFQYPGLGRLILEAVMKSDINLVMASLMMGTFMLATGNLIADILLKITDPRVES